MYYLFLNQDRDRYIQLTFTKNGQVATHTKWTPTPSTDFQRRDPDDKWSIRREWLSHNFRFTLIAKSPNPITQDTHPEVYI